MVMTSSSRWTRNILLLMLLYGSGSATESSAVVWDDVSAVPHDSEHGRLDANWVVADGDCPEMVTWLRENASKLKRKAAMAKGAKEELGLNSCDVVCLNVGTPVSLLKAAASLRRFDGEDINEWYDHTCLKVEAGWVNYERPAKLWYVDEESGERVFQGALEPGEANTHWRTVRLGHRFQVTDSGTEEQIAEYVAGHDAIHVVRAPRPPTSKNSKEKWAKIIEDTVKTEEKRSHKVKRTFTKHGYDKASLPSPLWADMATYWHMNRDSLVYEEWDGNGAYVNWWEAPPKMCLLPFGLKDRWHGELKRLVEEWIGGEVELERTDLYGMRAYGDNSILLPHVDREETHAVSMIINVAQYDMREPWMLRIMDLDKDDFSDVPMDPGQIVFYESARCLHGRPEPMQGGMFVNLFAHFRPLDDERWYKKDRIPADFAPVDHDPEKLTDSMYAAKVASLGDKEEQQQLNARRELRTTEEGTEEHEDDEDDDDDEEEEDEDEDDEDDDEPGDWKDMAKQLKRPKEAEEEERLIKHPYEEQHKNLHDRLKAAAAAPPKPAHVKRVYDKSPPTIPPYYKIWGDKAMDDGAHDFKPREKKKKKKTLEVPPPPPRQKVWADKFKEQYVGAHQMRANWRKVLPDFAIWIAAASLLLCCCATLRRRQRRRRRKCRLPLTQSSSKSVGRPPEGSASSASPKSSRHKMLAASSAPSIRQTLGITGSTVLPSSMRSAARNGRTRDVERWLETARTPDVRDAEPPRRTLLHHASVAAAAGVARACLDAGAEPGLPDDAGDSPLHLAAMSGSGAIVKMLLDAGAPPDAKDALGLTPHDRALEANNQGCALLVNRKIQSLRRANSGGIAASSSSSSGFRARKNNPSSPSSDDHV